MAKLSDRQKNNIIAKYKTGVYTNNQIAKSYKIGESTVRKICEGIGKENSDIVEAQTELENSKSRGKSAIDINAINRAVKYNLDSIEYRNKNIRSVHDVASDILEGLGKSVRDGKVQKVVTEGAGNGVTNARVVEYDYQPENYEKSANALHKVGQVYGVIETDKNVINNNNAQQTNNEVNNNLVVEFK